MLCYYSKILTENKDSLYSLGAEFIPVMMFSCPLFIYLLWNLAFFFPHYRITDLTALQVAGNTKCSRLHGVHVVIRQRDTCSSNWVLDLVF